MTPARSAQTDPCGAAHHAGAAGHFDEAWFPDGAATTGYLRRAHAKNSSPGRSSAARQTSTTCVGKSLFDHPLQERAIRAGGDLVQRHAAYLPKPTTIASPSQRRWRDGPTQLARSASDRTRSRSVPVLVASSKCSQHPDQHAAGRRDIGARGVRRGELVTDEPAMRVLEAARLALLPQPERIDDLLVREIERLAIDARELGLQHLDIERDVVADDHVGRGEHLDDLVGVLAELRDSRRDPRARCRGPPGRPDGSARSAGSARSGSSPGRRGRAGRTARSPGPSRSRSRWSRNRRSRSGARRRTAPPMAQVASREETGSSRHRPHPRA